MDIKAVITEEYFNSIKEFSYDDLINIVNKVIKLSVEESLRTLPFVVTNLINNAGSMQKLSQDFYNKHKDLNTKENRKVVARAIESLEGKNPGKSFLEILELAEPKAREMIKNGVHHNLDINISAKTLDERLKDL